MLSLWTAQYKYCGKDRIDIAAKSAAYPWNIFVPTWKMITNYKQSGKEQQYITQYNIIILKAFTTQIKIINFN